MLQPASGSFLAGKTDETVVGSTTPPNGDINPYAIWPVTRTVGSVAAGDVLVDDFNNSSNNQGTGTTIVDMRAGGGQSVFASLPATVPGCPGGVGLTTAMVQLKTGWVIVGSLPSTDGKLDTAGAGCLLVLSPTGKLAGTIAGSYLDGPWDATVQDNGDTATLFVSNTLIGVSANSTATVDKGDVVRLSLAQTATSAPRVTAETEVAGGLPERPDAAAFVKGPTGLALSPSGSLYIANTLGDSVDVVPDALTRAASSTPGSALTQGGQLANPLGLVLAPDGDLLAANSVNGKIVEITPAGKQVGEYYADDDIGQDPPGNGDLFDVVVDQAGTGVLFVNDATNTLELLH
ncbi:hypothetical protein GXW82_07305 [Streptacidiphilus sp. 4-A2]|nr:hypothetical protein [Streptacidiphilus sp. 4-A2]